MSELTLTILRMVLLGVLWLFIAAVLGVVRSDLFGTQISRRARRRRERSSAAATGAATSPGQSPAAPAAATTPAATPGVATTEPRGRFGRRPAVPLTLTVTGGKLAGTSIPLRSTGILIGRNPECSLVLDDDYASGRHAKVYAAGDQWLVEDLGSTNGTLVDGQRIAQPTAIGVGSTVRIGTTELQMRA